MISAAPSGTAASGPPNGGPNIVTHFIAGFPDYEASLEVARGLISGGAFALEMQIPFSDPSADGPVIESACRTALNRGFKVSDAFRLLRAIRSEADTPVFLMTYASLAMAPGVEAFIRRAAGAGASGLIVPDLVPGSDEGLYAAAASLGCPAVPVVVPWISEKRLDEVLAEPIEWIYAALRSGITGTYTELGEIQTAFLETLRRRREDGGPRVMAGFGIQEAGQAAAICALADAAIVGSALVKRLGAAGPEGPGKAVEEMVRLLRGARGN